LTKEISELCCDRKPKTLVKYGEQFASLYAPNAYGLSPEEIAFHLLEEVGEVSDALVAATFYKDSGVPTKTSDANFGAFLAAVRSRSEHIEKELADVFSWIVSLLEKAKQIMSSVTRLSKESNKGKVDARKLVQLLEVLDVATDQLNVVDILWKKYEVNGRLGHQTCGFNVCDCGKANQLLLADQLLPDEIRKAVLALS
jgi:NTP pyrophosphatase (non-canonical NTP hydrolase)